MITFLGAVPVMMKPPIAMSSPVWTRSRVEMFCNAAGVLMTTLAMFALNLPRESTTFRVAKNTPARV
jgi:hypothetical protein